MTQGLYWDQSFLEAQLLKTGNYNDLLNEYLISLGFTSGTLNDKMKAFLVGQGYTESIQDGWIAYRATL